MTAASSNNAEKETKLPKVALFWGGKEYNTKETGLTHQSKTKLTSRLPWASLGFKEPLNYPALCN